MLRAICILIAIGGCLAPSLHGAITSAGNVQPDVSTWDGTTTGGIGVTSDGSVRVDDGSILTSKSGYLGGWRAVGYATISGPGSTWSNNYGDLVVGSSGRGSLTVESGGQLINGPYGYSVLGSSPGSVGVVRIAGPGSRWSRSGHLYVGDSGDGRLIIEDGGEVRYGSHIYVARNWGSTGKLEIKGPGSKLGLTSAGVIDVGGGGQGTLLLEDGGKLIARSAPTQVDSPSGSRSTITVAGPGSELSVLNLEIGGTLRIDGTWSNGTVSIRGGGTLSAHTQVAIQNGGLLSIDIGTGSTLLLGNRLGTGILRMVVAPRVPAGDQDAPVWVSRFEPVQTLGGRITNFDINEEVFTVSDTMPGTSGSPLSLDLGSLQRVLVDDGDSDRRLGASLLYKAGASAVFTATALDQPLAGTDLGAWDIAMTGNGYAVGDPLYLSFSIEEGLERADLALWRRNGSTWSPYAVDDLTVSGGYASFTTTELGAYALTLAGDLDGDGDTDGRDFLAWQRSPSPAGLAAWQDNYGDSLSPPSEALAVPEPASGFAILWLCMGCLAVARPSRVGGSC